LRTGVEAVDRAGLGDVERLALGNALGDVEQDDVAKLAHRGEVSEGSADHSGTDIERLPPSAFTQLPRPIVRYLERRRCTVPQSYIRGLLPNNVISGEFVRRGQRDWALLCSRDGHSTILVFPGGSPRGVRELASLPDRDFLQTISGDGKIGYSRQLLPATRDELRGTRRVFGGHLPRKLAHEGLDNGFAGKSYTMYYYTGRHWLALDGGDGAPMIDEP
jgi:hypothetical protein